MTILYIHQYFKTPEEPGGTRSYWIAKKFIEEGHRVIMLTGTDKISAQKQTVIFEGIEIIYHKVSYNQKMGFWGRLFSFLRFTFRSTWSALNLKNIDLVYATSTPLTVGIPALLTKWLKKKPFIFEVRDLWPEVPIQMKGLTNPLGVSIARWLEKTIYQNASHIIALSPGMQEGVIKYVSPNKTSVIPNMAKSEVFFPREKNLSLLKKLDLNHSTFKIIHFGALGIANGAIYILKSAELLKDNPSVEFIFIGEGAQQAELISYCQKKQLKNVRFLGKFPMNETAEIVNLCDVSIVSFKNIPILYTNSPNKFFDSLSAGKPIIVNSAGWTKELVEKNQCGFYVNPEEPYDLSEKINLLQSNPNLLESMGKNARNLALKTYDKKILCQQVHAVVQSFQK